MSGGAHTQLVSLRGHLTSCRCKLIAPFVPMAGGSGGSARSAPSDFTEFSTNADPYTGTVACPPVGSTASSGARKLVYVPHAAGMLTFDR